MHQLPVTKMVYSTSSSPSCTSNKVLENESKNYADCDYDPFILTWSLHFPVTLVSRWANLHPLKRRGKRTLTPVPKTKKSRRKSSSRMLGLNPGVNLCIHFTSRLHTLPPINRLPLGWIRSCGRFCWRLMSLRITQIAGKGDYSSQSTAVKWYPVSRPPR